MVMALNPKAIITTRIKELEINLAFYQKELNNEDSFKKKKQYKFKIETINDMLKYNKYLIGAKD